MTDKERHIQDIWISYIKKYCHSKVQKINEMAANESLVSCLEMLGFTELVEEYNKVYKIYK